jgi:hypothetical protein
MLLKKTLDLVFARWAACPFEGSFFGVPFALVYPFFLLYRSHAAPLFAPRLRSRCDESNHNLFRNQLQRFAD